MAEGKKIGIITQARMTSTRLPGKIMIQIKGKPLLQYHVDRLAWSGIPIYIATTTNATDDIVADFATNNNLAYHRGSENNVLSRYYQCALKNKLDVVIRVTSDCPLIDGYLIREAADRYLAADDSNMYYSNCHVRTYPRGFDFEIFSFQLLEEAFKKATLASDLEHVSPYIHKNRSGRVTFGDLTDRKDFSRLRITLDTPEDLILIRKLMEEFDADKLRYNEIIDIFIQHPALAEINAHIEQKKV